MEESVRLANGVIVKVVKPKEEEDVTRKEPLLQKVTNIWSSSAGVGSDFFHVYRKDREREQNRLDAMDRKTEKESAAHEFEQKRLEKILKCEGKTRKNAEKRKKKKLAKISASKTSRDQPIEEDEEDDDEK